MLCATSASLDMFRYVCICCRRELYVEGDFVVVCESHPDQVIDYEYIEEENAVPEYQ